MSPVSPVLLVVIGLLCLVMVIRLIYNSQRRWLSFGYAVLGFGLVTVLGFVAAFLLVPARGSVMDINSVLDAVGTAVSLFAPIAALFGAGIPASRTDTAVPAATPASMVFNTAQPNLEPPKNVSFLRSYAEGWEIYSGGSPVPEPEFRYETPPDRPDVIERTVISYSTDSKGVTYKGVRKDTYAKAGEPFRFGDWVWPVIGCAIFILAVFAVASAIFPNNWWNRFYSTVLVSGILFGGFRKARSG